MSWLDACNNSLNSLSFCLCSCTVSFHSKASSNLSQTATLVKNSLHLLISPRVKPYEALAAVVPSHLSRLFSNAPTTPHHLALFPPVSHASNRCVEFSSNRCGMFLPQEFCTCCFLCQGYLSSGEPCGCSLKTVTSGPEMHSQMHCTT